MVEFSTEGKICAIVFVIGVLLLFGIPLFTNNAGAQITERPKVRILGSADGCVTYEVYGANKFLYYVRCGLGQPVALHPGW